MSVPRLWKRAGRELIILAAVATLSFALTRQAAVAGPSGEYDVLSGQQDGEDNGIDWCDGWCQAWYGTSYTKYKNGTWYFWNFVEGECWARA